MLIVFSLVSFVQFELTVTFIMCLSSIRCLLLSFFCIFLSQTISCVIFLFFVKPTENQSEKIDNRTLKILLLVCIVWCLCFVVPFLFAIWMFQLSTQGNDRPYNQTIHCIVRNIQHEYLFEPAWVSNQRFLSFCTGNLTYVFLKIFSRSRIVCEYSVLVGLLSSFLTLHALVWL